MNNKFLDLIDNQEIIRSLDFMGISEPTPIQIEAIPSALNGHDVLAESKTGSGKTISFGVPVINLVDTKIKGVQAIIITPTRELAKQVSQEITKLSKYSRGVRVATIYGGESYDRQVQTIRSGANIVVGTPGRIKDHLKRKTLKIENVKMLVLDEADVMLDMGFAPEINDILAFIKNQDLQTMLFSATIPNAIKKIAQEYLNSDYNHIKIKSSQKTADTIDQYAMIVDRSDKLNSLFKIIETENKSKVIIFSNTKTMCDELGVKLNMMGFNSSALHGDLKQSQRDKVMKKFREHKKHILIATDVAARGIDVSGVELVVNYDLPKELDFYVHRIGRSGRANNEGKSISLLVNSEKRLLKNIEKHINKQVKMLDAIIKPLSFEDVVASLNNWARDNEVPEKKVKRLDFFKESFENEEDYQKALVNIFDFYLDKHITKVDRNSKNSREDRNNGGSRANLTSKNDTRIHLNVGKMDKINIGGLLDLITQNTVVKNKEINNIKILDRFCFFDVPLKLENKVLKSLKNFNFRGRKISAVVAKTIKR